MDPERDEAYLIAAGRDVVFPFTVMFRSEQGVGRIRAVEALRVLPGKRLVVKGEWEGAGVVVKFFLARSGAGRHFLREKSGARLLMEGGIRTPELLFEGTLGGHVKVLGFREIRGASDMNELWEAAADNKVHQEIQSSIIHEIALQHQAGLTHEDLHLGNFLSAEEGVYTIDGDGVVEKNKGLPLDKEASLEGLALFFAQFYPRFDWLIRDMFGLYLRIRGWEKGGRTFERLVRSIEKKRAKRRKKYLKKVFRECTGFVCSRKNGKLQICDREFHDEEMEGFMADPDGHMEKGIVLKPGNTATVALVTIGGNRYAVKRYNIKSLRHALGRCLRETRASISWRNAHLLTHLGIKTPRPVVLMEKRWGPFRHTAYFVTEYLDAPDLYHLLHSDRIGEVDPWELSEKLQDLFLQLRAASIAHGDFKAMNFILDGNDLSLIDLDAMKVFRSKALLERAVRRDLKRFMKNWKALPEVSEVFRKRFRRFSESPWTVNEN